QGGYSDLGVGTSDSDYGRIHRTGKQFDVTDHLDSGLNGRLDGGCGQRDTRIHDELVSRTQQLRIQLAEVEVCHGRNALELVQAGRIGAGVADGERQITAGQIPGDR